MSRFGTIVFMQLNPPNITYYNSYVSVYPCFQNMLIRAFWVYDFLILLAEREQISVCLLIYTFYTKSCLFLAIFRFWAGVTRINLKYIR